MRTNSKHSHTSSKHSLNKENSTSHSNSSRHSLNKDSSASTVNSKNSKPNDNALQKENSKTIIVSSSKSSLIKNDDLPNNNNTIPKSKLSNKDSINGSKSELLGRNNSSSEIDKNVNENPNISTIATSINDNINANNEDKEDEESNHKVIPIKLNKKNDEFEIKNNDNSDSNNNNIVNQSPLEINIEENETEKSDVTRYSSSEDEKEKKSNSSIRKTDNNEINIPNINQSNKIKTPSPHDSPEHSEIEEIIEEEEYLTDDFEDDNELKNKEVTSMSEQEDTSIISNQNVNSIVITVESIQFKSDPEVQELLKDVKECFIAYEFLDYEPQDLTSNYSTFTNNQIIFNFSKEFNINESSEKQNLLKEMIKENEFQISIFRPPNANGISNELAFA
ncbi:hypothetical protein LY90DRAFT_673092, partial [Neocallimastix californiae]